MSNLPPLTGTPRTAARIERAVIKTEQAGTMPQRRAKLVGGGDIITTITTAKAQEAGQSDGTVSVKLLDAEGNVTGDAFDVYVLADKSATDITATAYWPKIATDDTLWIAKDPAGDYSLIRPDVRQYDIVSLMADFQVDGTNSKLQDKNRTSILVPDDGTIDGTWNDIHTGTSC